MATSDHNRKALFGAAPAAACLAAVAVLVTACGGTTPDAGSASSTSNAPSVTGLTTTEGSASSTDGRGTDSVVPRPLWTRPATVPAPTAEPLDKLFIPSGVPLSQAPATPPDNSSGGDPLGPNQCALGQFAWCSNYLTPGGAGWYQEQLNKPW